MHLSAAISPAELAGMLQAQKGKEDVFSLDLVDVLIIFLLLMLFNAKSWSSQESLV